MGSKLKLLITRNRFGVFLWIGIVLLVLGLGVFFYIDSVIRTHELMLQGDLLPQERDRWAGSLTWWRIAQISWYNPFSLICTLVGTFCVLYACASAVLQPSHVD